jgi:hypothetical protein
LVGGVVPQIKALRVMNNRSAQLISSKSTCNPTYGLREEAHRDVVGQRPHGSGATGIESMHEKRCCIQRMGPRWPAMTPHRRHRTM